jgi:hypothetical protein
MKAIIDNPPPKENAPTVRKKAQMSKSPPEPAASGSARTGANPRWNSSTARPRR